MILSKEAMSIDSEKMLHVLKNFPQQIEEAIKIGKECPLFAEHDSPTDYLIAGMGGSAIGADLLRSLCAVTQGFRHLRININRNYKLSYPISKDTYFIASSYSGNTEETMSALKEGMKSTGHLLSITSGGDLEIFSNENNIPTIIIPGGLQPRCALGYSFYPLLYIILRTANINKNTSTEIESSIEELLTQLKDKVQMYSELSDNNLSLQIAEKLHNRIPIVYSSVAGIDSVNLRLRCQIQENAKQCAFGNLLPEMNHNEINGYIFPEYIKKQSVIIFLKDKKEHQKIQKRFDAIENIFNDENIETINLYGEGDHLLTRMFDLIYLCDWISYWLAIINGVDPTPIPVITKLKNYISS